MATWTDTGTAVTSSKTSSTSLAAIAGYTPPSAGGWVVIFVCSDPTIPTNPTMTSSADTTNPVRFIR